MTASSKRRLAADPLNRTGDDARFFKGWLKRPFVTGAVSPSSRALGRAMSRFVPDGVVEAGDVVLELGPGTGVVTQTLIDRGVAEENLVLVEYSAEFCALLKARFPRATILEGDAYAPLEPGALGGRRLGTIVSSLPLFTKPDAMRETLIGGALDTLPPGHPFIQFSYALTLPVKPERLGAQVELSPWVKLNLPPARVIVYRRTAP
ncbi:phospholipid methyltransferase [Aureimonas sp. Leaf454]|nr:phospholipid methyltransferase [Aureimonas sp. Leaf454]